MGVEGAERMGWGPILARKKDFLERYCVAQQLFRSIPRQHTFSTYCPCYIVKPNTLPLNKCTRPIARDS